MIIGLAGRKGSGKNTFCEYGTNILLEGGISSAHISYAYPLKMMLVNMFGIPVEYAFGNDSKKKVSFGTWGEFFPETIPPNFMPNDQMSVRQMLQHLGTDIFRNKVSRNFWTDTFKRRILNKDYDEQFLYSSNDSPKIIFVTDVRFPNEIGPIESLGGVCIKINRDIIQDEHESENIIDTIPDEKFWEVLEKEQINGLRKLKLQVSAILYRLEVI